MRILLVIAVFFSAPALSQRIQKSPDFSVRGFVGIPRTVSSQMFRTAFNGVYECNVSVNARAFKNLSVGLGFQNTHFQNNKQVFAFKTWVDNNGKPTGAVQSYNTRLNCYGLFMRIGYDKFFEKTFVSYAINAGYMMNEYRNLNSDTAKLNKPLLSKNFSAPYLEPEISINFLTDGRLTFSLFCAYGTMLYRFDPRGPRFANIGEVADRKNKYLVSWINFGFGFNVILGDI